MEFEVGLKETVFENKNRPKRHLPFKSRMKIQRRNPYVDFISIQLSDDLKCTIKIRVDLPRPVEEELIKCLKDNKDLYACFPNEMSGTNLSMEFH